MSDFMSAKECKALKEIVAVRVDDGQPYIIPEGKYLVHASDGRWRATNYPNPVWLTLSPEQEALTEPTGNLTNDLRDWWDTN